MILVAGGTGTLGTRIVELLRRRDLDVRVLTRDPSRAARLVDMGAEVVEGDVGDRVAVDLAVQGARTVVSAIHGFAGPGGVSPAAVDRDGNHKLINAAKHAGVEHFVLLSIEAAAPDHPMDLMRMKYLAEQDLKASGVTSTIIRPTAYIETWCEVLGRPLLETGATKVFGTGQNPVNWVAASDVARLVELAVVHPTLRGETIGAYGPENLTTSQFVEVFQSVSGVTGKVSHVPRAAMRVAALLMPRIKPSIGRLIVAGLVMDTAQMACDDTDFRRRFPSIPTTTLADVVRRDFTGSAAESRPRPIADVAIG